MSESIFSVMSRLAQQHNAINLSQGFPEHDGPQSIKDKVCQAITEGKNHYAPPRGIPALRQELAAECSQRLGVTYDPETEVGVFSGATEALFCAFQALVKPGDEILVCEPFYESYPQAIGLCQGTVKPFPMDKAINKSMLEERVSRKTAGIVLNTPHNPSGRILHAEELQAIADFAEKHDLWIISDEVYEKIVYTPNAHVSPVNFDNLRRRTVRISSFSKTFAFTGWKIGFAFAPADIISNMIAVHNATVYCSATPFQHGYLGFSQIINTYSSELAAAYQASRDMLVDGLQGLGFTCALPQGSYFIQCDISGISQKPDRAFAEELTEHAGVAALPISQFYVDPKANMRYLRFCFCKEEKTLREALSRLKSYLS